MKILDLIFSGFSEVVQKRLKERVGGKANYKLKCPKCKADIDLGMLACPKCATICSSFLIVSLSRKTFKPMALLTTVFFIIFLLGHYDSMAVARGVTVPFIVYGIFSLLIMDKPL